MSTSCVHLRDANIVATPLGSPLLGDGGSREGVRARGTVEQITAEQVSYGVLASACRKRSFGCRAQTSVSDKPHLLAQQTPSGNPHTLFPLPHPLHFFDSWSQKVRERLDSRHSPLQVPESGRFRFFWIMGPDRVYSRILDHWKSLCNMLDIGFVRWRPNHATGRCLTYWSL
jgi:hypothetical protein